LSPEKGLEVLVDAARLVPDVKLVIAGGGPLAATLEDAVPSSVSLVGHRNQQDLRRLRGESVATVAPSIWHDVAPFSVTESAAAGRPIVTTRLGGLTELVEDEVTGLIVPPNDPTALAAAMKRLWDDRHLARRLGGQAVERARIAHNLTRAATQHIDVYREVLAA
jgi:glycosyltransferase involved in cell wall biosynthesis